MTHLRRACADVSRSAATACYAARDRCKIRLVYSWTRNGPDSNVNGPFLSPPGSPFEKHPEDDVLQFLLPTFRGTVANGDAVEVVRSIQQIVAKLFDRLES